MKSLIGFIAAAVLMTWSTAAAAHPVSCETLRQMHAQLGHARMLQLADYYGVSAAQRREAVACIHGRRRAAVNRKHKGG